MADGVLDNLRFEEKKIPSMKDQLRQVLRPERSPCTEEKKRFEQVRLALGVISANEVDLPVESYRSFRKVSEVPQVEFLEDHTAATLGAIVSLRRIGIRMNCACVESVIIPGLCGSFKEKRTVSSLLCLRMLRK